MRRGSLPILVALVAAVLIVPGIAIAAPSSSTSFNGKAAVYSRNADHYFVVSFTCSGGTLSGNWTYDVNSGQSFSGTLVERANDCAVVPSANNSWSSSTSPNGTPSIPFGGSTEGVGLKFGIAQVGTMFLVVSDIRATKTYFGDATVACPSSDQLNNPYSCLVITTDDLTINNMGVTGFNSKDSRYDPYGTLNLTLPRS